MKSFKDILELPDGWAIVPHDHPDPREANYRISCPHGDVIYYYNGRFGTLCERCPKKPLPNKLVVTFFLMNGN